MNPILRMPSYVYVMFFVLLYLGAKRCFAREVPVARPLLLPVLFVAFGLYSLNLLFPMAAFDANVAAIATLALGSGAGWLHASRWRVQFRDGASGLRVRLPGDASLLVTTMLTFGAESFMHYAVASRQPWAGTDAFAALSFAAWGFCVGLPLGRAVNVIARGIRHANDAAGTAYTIDPH